MLKRKANLGCLYTYINSSTDKEKVINRENLKYRQKKTT